jgi:hypothetical protein
MLASFLSLVKNSSGEEITPSAIVLADVYRNSIHKIINGAQSMSSIRQTGSSGDNLFAYQIPPPSGVFTCFFFFRTGFSAIVFFFGTFFLQANPQP